MHLISKGRFPFSFFAGVQVCLNVVTLASFALSCTISRALHVAFCFQEHPSELKPCPHCDQRFLSKSTLKSHMVIHEEPRFTCEVRLSTLKIEQHLMHSTLTGEGQGNGYYTCPRGEWELMFPKPPGSNSKKRRTDPVHRSD